MASKGGTTRQPLEQLKEMEKDGRIRRFLWDVITLRMFAYIIAQPASFVFILSLVIITLTMPPMAMYIKNSDQLPDLDTMRSWNAYLGRLSSMKLCISEDTYKPSELDSWNCSDSASAFLDFYVKKKALKKSHAIAAHNFTGSQLRTKIRDGTSSERIDDDVIVYLFLNLSSAEEDCDSKECKVQGCVDIVAPSGATPTRRPQIPNSDFSFATRVLGSKNKPADKPLSSCLEHYHNNITDVCHLSLGSSCDDARPQKEKYRHHGLINIDLTEAQQEQAYQRVLLGTLGMAAIALAFAVGIGCTDRPPKPKTSAE